MKMKRVIACILALLMLNTEIGSMGFTESEIVMPTGTEIASSVPTAVPTQSLQKNEGAKSTPKAGPAMQAESAQTAAVDSAPKGEGSPTVKALETETKVPETAQAPQTSAQIQPADTSQSSAATKPAATPTIPAVQESPNSVIPGEGSIESSAPAATPEITLAPETTEPLETSNAPEASITPEASATAEPEMSATPEVSATTEPGVSATPEASVTPEASESPLPFILENLTAERQTYAPGDVIRWNFTCNGAQSIDYEIRDRQGSAAAHGTLAEAREITFQTESCNTYTLTVNAHCAGETLSASSTVYVTLGDVGVSIATDMRYAVAGEWALAYQAQVSGGVAPYAVNIEVLLGNKTVYSEERTLDETGIVDIAYMPASFGEHTVKVAVTDALGVRAEASATLPVAVREPESASDWERSVRGAAITGDWREDLVAIAVTQLGYKESARDFTIDEDGKVQGYTRYGDWYGSAYEEWCAMFVSFCLSYAQIPQSGVPRSANCERWKDALSALGAYESDTDTYAPEKGDLIFFKDEKGSLCHVGIVERVAERTVYTIEGNSGKAVRRQSYARSDRSITGYASMRKLMDRAGILEQFEASAPQTKPEPIGALILVERYGELQGDEVNLRALPTVESEVGRSLPGGTQLWVVDGAEYADGYTWYSVLDEDGTLYYVRGDLLYIPEAEASAQVPTPVGEAELVEKTGVLSGNEANAVGLYALPLQDGEPALTLPGGAQVWVVSRAEYADGSDWYSVLYEDAAYYVRVDDLTFPEAAEVPAALAESVLVERYGILTGESVDLYTQPASQGEIAWTLPGGTQLWLVSMAEYVDGYIWYEALYEDAAVYYVRGDFLTFPEEKPAASAYAVEVTISPAVAKLGDTLTFTANIIGEAPENLSWQWQASADGADWYNIDGATEETYSVQADMTVFLQQYRVVAVETHEEETQDQTLLAFLDCLLFPAAIAETQTQVVYSTAVQPVLFSNGTEIYWNPNGSPTFDENGFIIVAAGKDANDGASAQLPVQSLDVAIALAEQGGVSDIICMNRSDLYAGETYDLKGKRLARYAGDGNSEAAHNGLFFFVKSGALTLSNAVIEETDTIIELDGGALALNDGLSLAGEIRIERPDAGILPITVNGANAAAGGKYVVSFDPDTQLERIGIASGDQLSAIALNAALTDDNWILYVDDDGNTYARKLPKYEFIYLDGVNGSDSNLGNTPQAPVLTFERAKALLTQYASQGVDTIYVMNTVGISDAATYSLSDTGAVNAKLVRYDTCTGPMFRVEAGAAATFDELAIDGNGANTALIEVEAGALEINGGSISGSTDGVAVKGGELTLGSGAGIQCTSGSGAAVTGGTLMVGNAMIRATNGGNGIAMNGGTLTVQSGADIQASADSAAQSGWGIVTTGGALDIQGGTISGRGGVFVNQGTQSASISGASISTVNGDIDHPALRINADAVNLPIGNDTTLSGSNAITMEAGKAALEGNAGLVVIVGGSFELISGNVNNLTITGGTAKVSGGAITWLNAENDGNAVIGNGTVSETIKLDGRAAVTVNGGTVKNAEVESSTANLYANGGAFTGQIHLAAGNSTVHTNGQASIGEICLEGQDAQVLLSGIPAQEQAIVLNVGSANLREEQIVVRPEGTLADASAALGKFALTSPTNHQFTLEGKENNIILRIKGVFVDTASGSDDNDGLSKDRPVKTFAKAAEVMKVQLDADPLFLRYINVLDEATISGTDTLNMAGYDNVRVVPYAANMATLITVPAGAGFEAANVRFDGSSGNEAALSANAKVLIAATGGTVTLDGVAADYANSEAIRVSGGRVTVKGSSTISHSGTGALISDGTLIMADSAISNNERNGVSATGGTFKMTGGSITGNGGANNGGGVYLGADAAAEINSVTISGNSGPNGGGVYLCAGAEAGMTDSKIENNSAENNGGGLYLECGAALNVTNKLTVSSNTATQGGGLYIGGGTDGTCVHALGNEYSITGNTATQGGGVYFACLGSMTLDGTALTNNSAELGGAICAAAGTTVFKSADTQGCSAATGGSALYIMKDATFDHASGTLAGSAYVEGTYKLNAADATVKAADEINLRNMDCPMTLYGDSVLLDSANKITVRVNEIFVNSIIVDGNDSVPASLSNFVVNGLPANEQNGDIIGGASIHVFWDPQNLAGNANDRNGGTSPTDAVSSFARAKTLLSQKSPESHIVMCSQYTRSGTFDGRVTNSTTGESWNATLVRGYAGNTAQTPLTGYMFENSGTHYFSNITFDDAEEMRLHTQRVTGGFVEASTIYLKAGTALKNSPSSAEAAIYAWNIYVQSPDVLFEGNDCAVLSRFNSTGTVQITGGTFKDNRYAIEINPNTNSYIRGTSESPVVFQGNTTAVTFGNMAQYNYTLNMAISYAEFTDNSTGLQGTTGNGTYGSLTLEVDNCVFSGNGTALSSGSKVTATVKNCTFTDAKTRELSISGSSSKTTITECMLDGVSAGSAFEGEASASTATGIYISGSGSVSITNTDIEDYSKCFDFNSYTSSATIGTNILIRPGINGTAIYTNNSSSSGKIILDGKVDIELNGASAKGIHTASSRANIEMREGWSIAGRQQGRGIYLDSTNYTLSASGGAIQNCEYGLYLEGGASSSCTLTDVEISGNQKDGIYADPGSSNGGNLNILGHSQVSNNARSGIYVDTGKWTVKIDGASIENNGLTGTSAYGGVYLSSSNIQSADILNTLVSGNRSTTSGGGIYANASVTLTNNTIANNQVVRSRSSNENSTAKGGGVYLGKPSTLTGNTITGNTAAAQAVSGDYGPRGGGVYVNSGTITLANNTISGNTAANGGGMYINAGEVILTGGSVAGNTASQNGGGVYLNSTGKATINGSGAITGNTAQYGGGIYAASNVTGELVLASGEVSANVSTADSGKSSGIYNAGRTLKMAGSRVDITDNIYLNHRDYPITLTSPLSGGSNYRIAVNANSYKVRDVVVQPLAGGYPSNVAQYLRNTTAIDAGFVFAKGTDPDVSGSGVNYIVIKRCIFVSDSGNDNNTGATPDEAYRTMAKALEKAGEGDYIIYVCGRVTASGNTTWSCAEPVEIRRYTGFAIGGTDAYPAYTGTMFSIPAGASVAVGRNISLISGRHTEEDAIRPTGSIFDAQGNLNFAQSTRIGGNISSADGGAIRVGQGGTVTISSALSIENTRGADGGAIYNEGSVLVNGGGSLSITNASAAGDGDAVYQAGTFSLENGASLSAAGTVYLTNDAHLTLASHAVTLTDPLNLDIADPYDGRVYVQYGSSEDADVQRARYSLPTRITSSYVLTDGVDGSGHLQLKLGQKNVVYVDPNYTGGTQEGIVQGITADYPFTNLKDAYEYLKDQGGGLIYIVDTIPVSGDVTVGETEYKGPEGEVALSNGGVSIKRYSQPEGEIEGFTHPTHTGALFEVQNGGSLTLDGVVVDGHSNPVTSASEDYQHTIAPAVEAKAPIVDVQKGGALNLTGGAQLGSNQNASGADAIENGGAVNINGPATVRGSVKLEPDKFITVTTGTQTQANAMEILLDDPEDGRVIAEYGPSIPDAGELEKYLLPEEILRDYYLAVDGTQVVLKAKKAAYVDGISGDDANDGLSPENPVRTLEQAYENLQANGGTIYIVNTVTIAEDMRLMPKQYIQGATSIEIASGDVRILRYSKPNAADTPTGFNVESFTGELIKVERGVSLALDGIVIDGHSQARNTGEETTAANGVAAESPLLRVYGTLEIENGAALQNNNNTAANTFGGAIHILATGKVKIVDGMIQGNDAGLGEGIFHFGVLEVFGTPGLAEGQWIYMGEDEVVHVTGAISLTSRLQVDFPADYYVDGHVVAVYADGLTPQPAQFTLGQTNLMRERGLSLVAEGQNLVLRAANAFDVAQDVTLYAAAEPADDQLQSVEIDLAGLGVDADKLQGLEFKVESVTLPDGSPLAAPVSSEAVKNKKTTAGSDYANSTVAITALPGGEGATPADMIEDQTLVFGPSLTADTAKLTLNLHCANAITAADTESSAPTLTIVLASADGDRITLNVKIVRIPSQINATVPLVIVVKTNIEGGSIQGSDLPDYAIQNESPMRVQLTDAVVTDSPETYGDVGLTPAENAPGLDEYRIMLDAATGQDGKLESAKDLFAYGEAGNTYNPIATIETGRLSFVTMQTAGGLEQGVKLANIAYKLAIPEDDLQP